MAWCENRAVENIRGPLTANKSLTHKHQGGVGGVGVVGVEVLTKESVGKAGLTEKPGHCQHTQDDKQPYFIYKAII